MSDLHMQFWRKKIVEPKMDTCCWSRGKKETQTQARKREHNRDSTIALQHIRLLGFFSLELIRCSACGLNLERVVGAISGLVSTRELVPPELVSVVPPWGCCISSSFTAAWRIADEISVSFETRCFRPVAWSSVLRALCTLVLELSESRSSRFV
jgi:hypothetical protein